MAKTLDELIESYGSHNSDFGSLKKVCDAEKEQIKSSMKSQGLSERTAGGYRVTYSVSERESVNEEKMLQILKDDWVNRYGEAVPCPYIKTREFVDMENLESVLYANELPKSTMLELDSCVTTSEVVTLRCSKAKKKPEETPETT